MDTRSPHLCSGLTTEAPPLPTCGTQANVRGTCPRKLRTTERALAPRPLCTLPFQSSVVSWEVSSSLAPRTSASLALGKCHIILGRG